MKPPRQSWLPASLAATILALTAGIVWLRMSTPSDGSRLELERAIWRPDGIELTVLHDDPGGLRSGDILLAIDGKSVSQIAEELFHQASHVSNRPNQGTLSYTVRRGAQSGQSGQTFDIPVSLGKYPLTDVLAGSWGPLTIVLAAQLMGFFVFLKRSREWAAQLFLLSWSSIAASQIVWTAGLQAHDLVAGAPFWAFWLLMAALYIAGPSTFLHLLLVWPQRNPWVIGRPWMIPAVYIAPAMLGVALLLICRLIAPGALAWTGLWQPVAGSIDLLVAVVILGVLVTSYLHSPRKSIGHLQLRWIMFGIAFSFVVGLILGGLPELFGNGPLIDRNLLALVGLSLPLSVAVAIFRYRLFDIDLIINRTLVYGALVAVIVGIYALVVGYIGNSLRTVDNLALSILAAALVALLFQPLRERLQRAVNRLMYGERDDPYAVLSHLGKRLEATLASDAVLPTIVETVAQALKLPYAAMSLKQGEQNEIVAIYGVPSNGVAPADSALTRIPLTYQSEDVGELLLAPRARNESFTAADMRLIEDVAHQAGVAAHSVRLTAELQSSRERLVTAREEERRRLRRDLHDGLGPALASLTLTVDAADNLLDRDPAAVRPLLADLRQQAQDAIVDIRRLVYSLRPPALDELGLVSALREQAAQYSLNGLQIAVEAPDSLPPLPAAVEVAAYRIAQEALTNVVRHAHAHSCSVRFRVSGGLQVEILDDGKGLGNGFRAGVGLASMRERAEELGGRCVVESISSGGTHVLACLPLSGAVRAHMKEK